MINAARAYLKTEGNLDYRDCKIYYYTYSMFAEPNKFKVNVNVWLHYTQNNFIKSLNLDESFDKEATAIEYGTDQGKKFIDKAYELGKITAIKPDMLTKAKDESDKK